MTYRELFEKNAVRDIAANCHIGRCPDTWLADLTHEPRVKIACPPNPVNPGACPGERGECARCWNQQIPEEAALPDWAKQPDCEVWCRINGDEVHVHTDGSVADIMTAAVNIVKAVAEEAYANGKDEEASRELVRILQNAFAPTSKIWDFMDGGEADGQ